MEDRETGCVRSTAVAGESDLSPPGAEHSHSSTPGYKHAATAGVRPRPCFRWEPPDVRRIPLAAVLDGAPHGLCVRGALPEGLDLRELALLARRWSR